jgi:tetratricopeptide (TPR) repeat protein
MKVPFHLGKRAHAEPATALLLATTDVRCLLDVCERLGTDLLPRIVPVADGYLLQLTAPSTAAFPRAIRLRALCPNLLLPVDAELLPAMWDYELQGLVRERGLIFLPGGRVLGFALDDVLPLSALLQAPVLERADWQPFPSPPALAERLQEIRLELPPPTMDEIFEAGGGAVGIEEPRPEGSGTLNTVANQIVLRAGQGLFSLGQVLHLGPLAQLGARWMQRAVERVPRLSESVLGKQEAALRELLRLFRMGKVEEALRRALPLGGPGGRGGTPAQGSQLPVHRLIYSLAGILGSAGPAAIWFGGYDVQRELAESYRRAAEQALKQGDCRRAAFIYGKLLQDYRAAANALFKGGLFRDAAVIYLKQLDDRRAAAGAFEAAGETDEALRLYRQLGDHVAAGDLLTRLGEPEAAFLEYRRAADLLAGSQNWLAAGELLLHKATRHDLTQECFERGWASRPEGNAVPCALRLARLFQSQAATAEFLALTRQARTYFDCPGIDSGAVEFYHTVARLADETSLLPVRDEARDAALLGLAVKLRQRVAIESKPGDLVSTHLGRAGIFPASVVSDARQAVKAALRAPSSQVRPAFQRTALSVQGQVTAVCSAANTGDLFVAFDTGELVCFRPASHETVRVCADNLHFTIGSLAVDDDAKFLATVQEWRDGSRMIAYTRSPKGAYHAWSPAEFQTPPHWVSPRAVLHNGAHRVTIWDGSELKFLDGPTLTVGGRVVWSARSDLACWGALLTFSPGGPRPLGILLWDQESAWFNSGFGVSIQRVERVVMSWNLSDLRTSPVCPIPLDFLFWGNNHLELAGIDNKGGLVWSLLRRQDEGLVEQVAGSAVSPEGYQTAAIVHPGRVAAAAARRVDWLRFAGQRFVVVAQTPLDEGPAVVAAFRSLPTRELLLLRADGGLERLPFPGGVA